MTLHTTPLRHGMALLLITVTTSALAAAVVLTLSLRDTQARDVQPSGGPEALAALQPSSP